MAIYKSTKTDYRINKITEGGSEQLRIVADFDGTITYDFNENGERIPSGVALLRDSGLISVEYSSKANELFAKYHPYEIDLTLSPQEKSHKMYEWWTTHLQLLVESKVSKEIIDTIVQSHPKMFRKHTDLFFAELNNLKIPLLIFSAGIGDIIDSLMNLNGFVYPNIQTLSNYFIYDENGQAVGYNSDQIIHTFNKNEASIPNLPGFHKIQNRPNVILLGNSPGDVAMADGIQTDTLLKIGFLDKPDQVQLQHFLEIYDVVITNRGDFEFVNNLITQL